MKIQINLDNEQNLKIEILKAIKNFKTKEDTIKSLIDNLNLKYEVTTNEKKWSEQQKT